MTKRVNSSKAKQALPLVNAKFTRFVNPSFHHTCRFFAQTAKAIVSDHLLVGLEYNIVNRMNLVTYGRFKLFKKGLVKGMTQMLLNEKHLKQSPSSMQKVVTLLNQTAHLSYKGIEQTGALAGKGAALIVIPAVVILTTTLDGLSFLLNRVLTHNIDVAQTVGNGLILAGDFLYNNRELALYFTTPLLSFITTGNPFLLLDNLVMVQCMDLSSELLKRSTQLILQGTRSETFKDLQSMYQKFAHEGPKEKKVVLLSLLKQISLPALTLLLCTIPLNRTAIIHKHLKTMFEKFHYNLNVQTLLMSSLVLTFNYLNKQNSQQKAVNQKVKNESASAKIEKPNTGILNEMATLGSYTAEAILNSYHFKLLNPFKRPKVDINAMYSRLAA